MLAPSPTPAATVWLNVEPASAPFCEATSEPADPLAEVDDTPSPIPDAPSAPPAPDRRWPVPVPSLVRSTASQCCPLIPVPSSSMP